MLLDSASTLCKAFVDKTVVCGLWSVVYGHPALVPLYKTYREESDGNIGRSSVTHLSMLNIKALNTFDFC